MKNLLAAWLIAGAAIVSPAGAWAQDKTEITVSRFFGACQAEYGAVTKASDGNGECGIITALINEFNATSADYVVNEEIVEWPGYDQLTARLRTHEAPTVSVMHQSVLSDYVSRDLLQPLTADFAAAGIDVADFTPAARAGVEKAGDIYALPFDTIGWLWHINLDLLKQAGLLDEAGKAILPTSPEELLAQARQFKEKTGKPYLIAGNNLQENTRTLFTLLYQQGNDFFADPQKVVFNSDEARNFLTLYKTLHDEELITRDLDYSAATSGFTRGIGGVYVMGTWLIDTFNKESQREGSAIKDNYAVVPYPQLYGTDAIWSDGHSWVMPKQELSAEQRAGAIAFMKFLWDNDYEWARTGHLPARQSVLDSAEFKALPHRATLMRQAEVGRALPSDVKRQFFILDAIGEEMSAAIRGEKSIDEALIAAETRTNGTLANAK